MEQSSSPQTRLSAANRGRSSGDPEQAGVAASMQGTGEDRVGEPGLRCIRLDDPYRALGLAANMLAKVEPYAQYRMDGLIPTLMAEIQRGHYLFTLKGERVLGYAGWALCTPELARAWVEGRYKPNYAECVNGSAPVLVTFHSKSRAATVLQIRYLRSLYPGQEVFFRRYYGDGHSRHARVLNVAGSPGPRA